jgi:uncharacterized membrane protein
MSNKPAVESHKSSLGDIDANLMALLAYVSAIVIGFIPGIRYINWAAPLALWFLEKKSSFIRFHAMQSFVLNAVGAILGFIVSVILGGIVSAAVYNPFALYSAFGFSGIITAISWIISVAFIVFGVLAMVNAYKYVEYRIPVIAKISDKIEDLIGKK